MGRIAGMPAILCTVRRPLAWLEAYRLSEAQRQEKFGEICALDTYAQRW